MRLEIVAAERGEAEIYAPQLPGVPGRGTIRTPATWLFLGANILMWVVLEAAGGSQDTRVLLRFGAKFGPQIADGEYWRLFVPIFLHIGFFHLLTNSIGLLIFGRIVEGAFGSLNFAAIYLLSGVFGNIASYAAGPTIGAGASGAIFGIVGAYAAYLLLNRSTLGQVGRSSFTGLGILIVINLIFGFSIGGVDNWAHLGGLASGFLIALPLTPRMRYVSDEAQVAASLRYVRPVLVQAPMHRWLETVALSAAAIGLMVWSVGRDYPYPTPGRFAQSLLADAAALLDEDRFLEAQRKVGEAIRIDPGPEHLGILYLISGLALAEEGQYRPAEENLRIALRFGLSPDNEARALAALRELGVVR